MNITFTHMVIIPALSVVIAGCGAHDHSAHDDHDHDNSAPLAALADDHAGHDHAGHDHASTGIALTASVREHLGITFAKAEYRVVQGLLRMPGQFESEPSARRAYQAPLAGRVEVLVKPYQHVAAGDPLYRVASADWHTLQRDLATATVAAGVASEQYRAGEAHLAAVSEALRIWRERAATLERLAKEVGGKAPELAEATSRAADLLVQHSEARVRVAQLKSEAQGADGVPASGLAAIRLRDLLTTATHLTGLDLATLTAEHDGVPRWQTITEPMVVATAAGMVEREVITSGTWVEAYQTVLTVTDPSGVRLRASALQSDLARLRDGLPARIVGADPLTALRLDAAMVLAPVAEARDRSIDVIARPLANAELPAGVRPGVAAVLEVAVTGSNDEELAIPLTATIRDGLQIIFFKRNRTNPDVVEKVEADLGANDGRWVVLNSGVKEGDEVVVGGIYPLKLSQQSGGTEAGHFEADGTFHTGKH